MRELEMRHILVPTDLSDSGIPALRYARVFADRLKASLLVLYSDPIVYPIDVTGPVPSLFVSSTPEHQARLRADVEAHVGAILKGAEYTIEVTTGQPGPRILEVARKTNADLIVMGTHGRHGWRRALVGSVAEGVITASPVPVLTVNREELRATDIRDVGIARIICPINFTPVASEALLVAAQLARLFSSELIVVHVIEPGQVTDLAADQATVRRWVEPKVGTLWTYRELLLRGGPAERVLDSVDDLGADLLVIGAQHKMLRDVTVIGTTSERLVRFAPCPVLVVPAPVLVEEKTEEPEKVAVEA